MVDESATRIAEAVRAELGARARKEIGSYHAIADATGVSYKSVYRYLGDGKDRVMPPFPFVVQLVELLRADYGGDDFTSFWEAAVRDVQ